MRSPIAPWTTLAACALLACRAAPPAAPPPPGREAVLASFVADVDAATGALTIRADSHPSATAALGELPTVRDGHSGSGPPDTVELVTEDVAGAVADGCAPGLSAFEGSIRVRSFYATSHLRNVHVELTGMTATGYEACGSAFPVPDVGIGRGFGLFPYGTLTRAGTAGDSAIATWRFRYPSATSFTFWGRVVGEIEQVAPPTVTGTSPANGATASAGEIAVGFSEPMEPTATAAAIAVTGPGGGVAGTVAASQGNQVFTFTPAVPLAAGTSYTISVATSAIDPLGTALAAPFGAAFTTGAQQLSGAGAATVTVSGIAYDGDGNGLAAWRAGAGATYWSYYAAASAAWSEPVLLDTTGSPLVAASATQFAVAWHGNGGLHVVIFTNGLPGATTTIPDAYGWYSLALASNGGGFAAVWGAANRVGSAVWDGSAWTSLSASSDANAYVQLAAEGAAYRAVWMAGTNLRSARYADGAWSTATTLGTTSTGINPALAASPTTTCIVWYPLGGFSASARLERGGSSTTTAVLGGASNVKAFSAAVIGDRCQVAAAAANGVHGASHDGTAWTTSSADLGFASALADAVSVAPLGTTGFAVAARVVGATSSDVLVARTTGWAFSGPAATLDVRGGAARGALAAPAGASGQVAFAQADDAADRLWVAPVDPAAGGPVAVSNGATPATSKQVRLAANASGGVLAVWSQEHLGQASLFWSYRSGGAWSAPQLLAAGASAAAVASNRTDFMVAWVAAASSTTGQIVFKRFVSGAWVEPAAAVTSGSTYGGLQLASDGAGYALAYFDRNYAPYAVLYDGGSWLTPARLNVSSTSVVNLQVAGRALEYLFAWPEGDLAYYRRIGFNGSAWVWGSMTVLPGASPATPALAAGPGEFALVYRTSASPAATEVRLLTGGALGGPTTLRSGSSCESYAVASSGTTYLAATGCQSTTAPIESRVWNGAWQPARALRANAYVVSLSAASDGTGYAILADGWPSHGGLVAIAAPEPVAGPIGAPVTLGAGSGDGEHGVLVGSTGGFVAAWKQPDALNATVSRIYALGL